MFVVGIGKILLRKIEKLFFHKRPLNFITKPKYGFENLKSIFYFS
jgi:hypothetical protein